MTFPGFADVTGKNINTAHFLLCPDDILMDLFCFWCDSDEAVAAFLETSGECLKELSLNNITKVSYVLHLSHTQRAHTVNYLFV